MPLKNNIKPFLKTGDSVALIAPSSGQKPNDMHLVKVATELLKSWGLIVKYQPSIGAEYMYLSAKDNERLAQIELVFHDDDIKAIFCTRGGYGLSRIINHMSIAKDISPKCLIGYSDITALHLHFLSNPKIQCIHGPVLASPQMLMEQLEQDQARENLKNSTNANSSNTSELNQPLVNQQRLQQFLFNKPENQRHAFEEDINDLTLINNASDKQSLVNLLNDASTVFTGGNLTMVACSLATPHEIETKSKVLLLEEVYESPYRIDRLISHLQNAGKFNDVKAVVFGQMYQCESKQVALSDVLADLFENAPFPVAMGLPFGHAAINYPWLY